MEFSFYILNLRLLFIIDFYQNGSTKIGVKLNKKYAELSVINKYVKNYDANFFVTKENILTMFPEFREFVLLIDRKDNLNLYKIIFEKIPLYTIKSYIKEIFYLDGDNFIENIKTTLKIDLDKEISDSEVLKVSRYLQLNPIDLLKINDTKKNLKMILTNKDGWKNGRIHKKVLSYINPKIVNHVSLISR